MFGVPTDAAPIWIGLLLASAGMFGVISGVPTAAPPSADRVAATIDQVAARDITASGTVGIHATEIKLGTERVALRGPGGTAHASPAFGPVTPVSADSRLSKVLHGAAPGSVYVLPRHFRNDLERARKREPTWKAAPSTLHVRRVSYGEVTCVLVGA
ncbi:MAG: hypothetical protein ABEJ27_06640 [Halodesulfurarchaeum sp.]